MQQRPMRRKDRRMLAEDAFNLLKDGEFGVLATVDAAGQPYGVPLSYANTNEKIYFHSAMSGHKLDNIGCSGKVTFTVVGQTEILPAKFSTDFESVVVFGDAALITDEAEKRLGLKLLAEKYSPGYSEEADNYINKDIKHTTVVGITIRHITGKKRNPRKT